MDKLFLCLYIQNGLNLRLLPVNYICCEDAMNAFISSSLGSSIMYFRTKMLGSNPAVAYFTIVSPFSVQSRMPTGGLSSGCITSALSGGRTRGRQRNNPRLSGFAFGGLRSRSRVPFPRESVAGCQEWNGFHFVKGSFYRVVNRGYKLRLEYVSLLKSLSAGIIHLFASSNSADGNRRIGSMNSALSVCRISFPANMYCAIGSFSCG